MTAAVALGVTLALLYLRGERKPVLAIAHGLIGATGFCLLLIVLRGPRRGDAMGMGSFGTAAAVLFGLALTLGPSMVLLFRRAPRIAGLAVAAHATLAITAFVLLLAWLSAG